LRTCARCSGSSGLSVHHPAPLSATRLKRRLDGKMPQTLAGKGSKDDFKTPLELVPEGNRKSFQSDFNRRGSFPPSGFPNVAHEVKFSKEEAQTLIENIKTSIDNLSSSSQLDMIKLQGLINKRNQTIEMMTNLMQKLQKTNDAIVGNMR
jgi:hypothetical protein